MKTLFTILVILIISISVSFAATVTVTASGDSFTPANLTINVGDDVHWVIADGTHDVTSGTSCTADGKFASGTKTVGQTFDFVFSTAGSFPYYCSFHCSFGMVGTVTVTGTSGINSSLPGNNAFTLFPNPFPGIAHLDYTINQDAVVSLDVFNISGQKVFSTAGNEIAGHHEQMIDLGKMPKGMYFLNISLNGIMVQELKLNNQ